MKKRTWMYFSVIACICIVFSFVSYISYMEAYKMSSVRQLEENKVIKVEKQAGGKIKEGAMCLCYFYYMDEGRIEKKIGTVSEPFIGWSRTEISSYLEEYAENVLENEKETLVYYDLLSFSEDKLVVQKSFQNKKTECQYLLGLENNIVVVYDKTRTKNLENTGILAEDLLEEDRKNLSEGIWVEDEGELYSILEDYSS